MKKIFILCLCLFISELLPAQGTRNILMGEETNGRLLKPFLQEVEKSSSVDFLYVNGAINNIVISGISGQVYFNNYIEVLLKAFGLKLIAANDQVFFIVSEDARWEYGRRKDNYLVFQEKEGEHQLIKGIVNDSDASEPLFGAQVVIPSLGAGVMTDMNGYFELRVPKGVYELDIRFIGYETASYIVGFSPLGKRQKVETSLLAATMQLEGVTITADRQDENVQALVPGVEKLGMATMKKLPTFLGEIDPVKSMTTLPGVSTVGELSAGFNVRGGESGQNLILQDGAVIYNPTHLFGFFSAFNPDIVSDVSLYKGGGPARFGGRVSSTLDVKLRSGDVNRYSVSGGVGLVSSRLSVEGPILGEKTSFLVGGRLSYSNWLLKATENIQLQNSSANFHDLTAKVFHRFNKKDFISISGYRSYDDFRFAGDSTYSWGTTNFALHWDHTFNDNVFSNFSIASSRYFSQLESTNEIEAFIYKNAIDNLRMTYHLSHTYSEPVSLNYGLEFNRHDIEPGRLDPSKQNGNVLPIDIQNQHTLEGALYLQGDVELSSKWAISAGLRYSHFLRYGKDKIYTFDYSNYEGRYPAITDSVAHDKGDIIKDFGGLEPRISLRYLLNEQTSLKASYFRTYQYLHLISNTTSVTPQDYWVASGPYLEPEIGDQYSLGYFKNLRENTYEFSVEGFYKETRNAVDYIEGADITLNKALEAGLLSGRGLSYGVEVLARKNAGKLNGWIAYTYSRSLRQFKAGENENARINEGDYYPSTFDQPHNLSLILNYKVGKRSTLSSSFSYSTGRPITIPISKFSYAAYLAVLNYSRRNEYRIPDYHRLDLSLTIEGRQTKNTRFKGDWVFSIYNIYGRKNAYSIFFSEYGTARKLSILGNAFPSVNYNFKF